MTRDLFVEYSNMHGGWCVFEQTTYANYEVIRGPFAYSDQAEYILEVLLKEIGNEL